MVLNDNVSAIIDFEILIGPKMLDIAVFYTEFGMNSYFMQILKGYNEF